MFVLYQFSCYIDHHSPFANSETVATANNFDLHACLKCVVCCNLVFKKRWWHDFKSFASYVG